MGISGIVYTCKNKPANSSRSTGFTLKKCKNGTVEVVQRAILMIFWSSGPLMVQAERWLVQERVFRYNCLGPISFIHKGCNKTDN